ncbi:MAG: hypothetical protein ACLQIB_17290 [Isosphaeraceae bacterium]
MNSVVIWRGVGSVIAGVVLGVLPGCGSDHARYTPTSTEARASLETALTAWREGKPVTSIDVKPPVHVFDSAAQGGQQIESFTIGDEQDKGDGTKQFAVKLVTKPKGSELDVKFVVHGRDPVYVFREEDYLRSLNMDNNPQSPPPKPGARQSGRQR